VLYSGRDARWKLADFGSAAQATSKHLHTTIEYRGTASYRAPELLNAGRFNNKVDVFALGCIIYEMVTGRQLFAGDYSVLNFAQTKERIFPRRWPRALPDTPLFALGKWTEELIAVDPSNRPTAATTIEQLGLIRKGLYKEPPWMKQNPLNDPLTPMLTVTYESRPPWAQRGHMWVGTVPVDGWTYRLGLHNPSNVPVQGACVRLLGVEPEPGLNVLPLTLRKKDDNTPPYVESKGFTVAPGTVEFIDIVMTSADRPIMEVQHIVPGVIQDFLPSICTLSLSVQASNLLEPIQERVTLRSTQLGTVDITLSDGI
jgi:serine/threonine protein kinase